MKKIPLILSTVAASALLALSAGAAPTEYKAASDGSFSVTYSGTAGEYYALVVVEGITAEGGTPTITESSIQYIDQVTADANGKASFENFLLKNDGTAATVFLGGSDLSEAKLLGYVNKASDNFTVSGKVTSDSSKEATVTLTSTTDATKTYTVTTTSGTYTVSVPGDTYKFVVTKKAHLSYTKNAFAVAKDETKDVTLVGGDIDGNGSVSFDDLMSVMNTYSTANNDSDINGDGTVGFEDLMLALNHYEATSTVE